MSVDLNREMEKVQQNRVVRGDYRASTIKKAEDKPKLSLEVPLNSKPVKIREVLTEDFIKIKDHPSQRDTEMHAAKAKNSHLSSYSEAHRIVSVALYNKEYYKLDGHTRSLLWASKQLAKPKTVFVSIYECETKEDLVHLYDTFDNKKASKDSKDDVSSAMRYHGIELTSPMMKKYKYNNALRLLYYISNGAKSYASYSTIKSVGMLKDEIIILDRINPNSSVFYSGVIVGSLMLLRKYGEKIVPFLAGINTNDGKKDSKVCDAVYAANRTIEFNKEHTGDAAFHLASKIISCGEAWIMKRTYIVISNGSVHVKPTQNLPDYFKASSIKKEEAKSRLDQVSFLSEVEVNLD